MALAAYQKRAIAVEAMRDPRSVDRVLEGKARPLTEAAIRAAAAKLGIELPPPSSPAPLAKAKPRDGGEPK